MIKPLIEAIQHRSVGTDRAVSPVIGVILMVAITVILAAVIGAFVLEIGDQQETAPNTSFTSEEEYTYMWAVKASAASCSPCPDDKLNTSVMSLTHAGGDTIAISQIDVTTNGDPGAWGLSASTTEDDLTSENQALPMEPAPDVYKTLGTNEKTAITSGERMSVLAYGTVPPEDIVQAGDNRNGYTYIIASGSNSADQTTLTEPVPRIRLDAGSNNYLNVNPDLTDSSRDPQTAWLLESGDTVAVNWEAESGGKTQRLFTTTVERTHDTGL